MNVPIEVIRNGNTEKYIEIERELLSLRKLTDQQIRYYNEAIRNIYELSGTNGRQRFPYLWHSDEFPNQWREAMAIEKWTQQLIESAGLLAEYELKRKRLIAERSALGC
ncbi:hypothetical protein M1D49_07845 [Bacillus sp. PK3-056]|uniref:hypothetical protein n=1 Tax=Niallia circulans TaxID=1397 RepID=UPI000F45B647|nr:hypothetical protein [Niallia circulans]AYV74269.1 hypothetical protein C2H98_23420 [Niallia circulans]